MAPPSCSDVRRLYVCSGDGSYFAQDVEKADQYTRDGDSAYGATGLEEMCVSPIVGLEFTV